VNNRDLKTFEVDISNSILLRNEFKQDNVFVSESGIKSRKDIDMLKENNINVFLIGESLMKGDFFET
jgi:indole-3-glycerol phosphate synthase